MKKLLIIFVLFLCFSCVKKCNIHITAKNAVTGAPYPGLHYEVIREHTGMWEEKYKKVASGILDENGEAMVTKHILEDPIRIMVERPENWCYEKNNQYYLKGDGPNYEVNVEFAECATLQRKVKNINCFNANDKIEIYIDNSVHSLTTNPWVLSGCANYTTVPTQFPVGLYSLHWTVTKNNITTSFSDSFNLTEYETKVYEINY